MSDDADHAWRIVSQYADDVSRMGSEIDDLKRENERLRAVPDAHDLIAQLSLTTWQLEYIVEMHRAKNSNIPGALAIQCEIKAKNARAALAKAQGVAVNIHQREGSTDDGTKPPLSPEPNPLRTT